MGDGEDMLMHLENKLEDVNKNSFIRDIFYSKLADVYRFKLCCNELRVPKIEQVYLNKGDIVENLAEIKWRKTLDPSTNVKDVI